MPRWTNQLWQHDSNETASGKPGAVHYSSRAKLGVNDSERATKALRGIVGKRLTYRRTDKRPETPSLG
jgi:hypothetical protein